MIAFKVNFDPDRVDTNKKDAHRCVHRKDIDKVRTATLGTIGKGTARARFYNTLAILVHTGRDITLAYTMEGSKAFKVAANWVCVKRNKHNTQKERRHSSKIIILDIMFKD